MFQSTKFKDLVSVFCERETEKWRRWSLQFRDLSSTNSDVVHIVYKSETGGNGMRALWHPVVVEKNYSLVSQWQKTSQAMIVMLRESLIIIFSLTQRGEKFYVIHPFPPHFIGTHITYGCFLVNCWWWWAAGRFHLSRLCIFLVTLTDQTM